MSIVPLEEETQYLDGLLERLGVPANRVLLVPAPGTATEQDLLDHQRRTGRGCELVEGTLVERPVGLRESAVAGEILGILRDYNRRRRLGILTGEQGTMRLMQGLVRIPDVAFIRSDRLPGGLLTSEPIPDLAPDLAVEVLSASNTHAEMQRKCREYFLAGTQLVWLVDVDARTVTVYTAGRPSQLFSATDTLDGGEVLPGFQLPVRDIFDPLPLAPTVPSPRTRRKKK